ncbi:MAG: GyrI-like domain-containing protein [Cryobacterium sp.]
MKAERVELEPRTILGVHGVVPMTDMTDFFGRAFTTSAAELGTQGAHPAGPALAIYHGKPGETADVTAGFPASQPVTGTTDAVVVTLPGGPAIQTIHTGSYDDLGTTYGELRQWVAEQQLDMAEDVWEEYLTGPDSGAEPATWQTLIVWPLA